MAENFRDISEILDELFKGNDSAITNLTKVSHTHYQMCLWCNHRVPLSDIDKGVKSYFSKRFLDGCRIDQADEKTLREGFKRLDHAVHDGCRGRCRRLVVELNQAFAEVGLSPVKDIDKFLDWLTLSPRFLLDHDGNPLRENPDGTIMLPIFDDDRNREEFRAELRKLQREGKMASLHDVATLVVWKRKHLVSIK